jgi:hypothetical protein
MDGEGGGDVRVQVPEIWQAAQGALHGAALLVALAAYGVLVAMGCGNSEPLAPKISDRITWVGLAARSATDLPACAESVSEQYAYVSSPPSLWWCAKSGRWVQAGRLSARDVRSAEAQLRKRHTPDFSVAAGTVERVTATP